MLKRLALTPAAYLISLLLVATLSFVVVLVLAGPHAGLLPAWLEIVILCMGWLAVLLLPAMIALRVWRRTAA